MKVRSILSLSLRAGLAVFVLFVTVSILFGQDEVEAVKAAKAAKAAKADHKERAFCSNNNWSGPGKVSFSELREVSLAAAGSLAVDGGRNGGIKVRGENRPDVLVRAVSLDDTRFDRRNGQSGRCNGRALVRLVRGSCAPRHQPSPQCP
jgi:hypothetical protein